MDNGGRVWYIRLCDLRVLLVLGWLAHRWNPDGNNHVNDVGNGLDDINGCSGGDVLSLLQRHGGRQGQYGAESEGCG